MTGTIAGHTVPFQVLKDHAETEPLGLGSSRIHRLGLLRQVDRQAVANFDRGRDLQLTTDDARAIVDCLTAGVAETPSAGTRQPITGE